MCRREAGAGKKKKARGGDGKVSLFPSSTARLLNKRSKADFTVGNTYILFVTNISEGTRAYYFLLEIPSGSPFTEERVGVPLLLFLFGTLATLANLLT